MEIRLATRGSALARRQAETVRAALADRRHEVAVREVETEGDRVRDELIEELGTVGAFVRSLDQEVLAGDADAAVHSLKDVPTEGGGALVVAAVPERAAAADALVTPDGAGLDELPAGATVGTSSARRRSQLLAARPDLEVRPLRGNVDTRVEKLLGPGLQREHERRLDAHERDGDEDEDEDGDDGPEYERTPEEWFDDLAEVERAALGREVEAELDAVVLALAGLRRSGLARQVAHERLPPEEFVPAPGQGALAVVGHDDDAGGAVRAALDHPRSRVETAVERAVLAGVGGGCIAPVGVHAVVQGDVVRVRARVLGPDGEREVGDSRELDVETPVEDARALAADLVDRGANELVEEAA
jgi:hydroxymethylbilane synthase